MNIQREFEEFLRLLNDKKAEFVVIGGYAVAFHGYIRNTNDLDILFRNTPDNIEKIINALVDFNMPRESLDKNVFAQTGNIIRLGVPPVRIELLNEISALSFDDIWKNRIKGKFGSEMISYIGVDELKTNKKAAGRPKDLADVDELTRDND